MSQRIVLAGRQAVNQIAVGYLSQFGIALMFAEERVGILVKIYAMDALSLGLRARKNISRQEYNA